MAVKEEACLSIPYFMGVDYFFLDENISGKIADFGMVIPHNTILCSKFVWKNVILRDDWSALDKRLYQKSKLKCVEYDPFMLVLIIHFPSTSPDSKEDEYIRIGLVRDSMQLKKLVR